ncbi:KamA family radical SAM protein [Pararhodospirillum oryzae]|uniref:Lysine 2,3-aminomutase n=1 Tax=Pararhodospirillum oryzae TaxID=478448 RepID=A0A512HBB5_9PROT|nr:KamA family radical SAM protein [Pararhodospirillum oryzae]GEO82680.1 lysine 2,3-aminomutase [Pararhodospirillum oryzae]
MHTETYRRIPGWETLPLSTWQDWHWQMANRVTDVDHLADLLGLDPAQRTGALGATRALKMALSPYLVDRLRHAPEPDRTILARQFVPQGAEVDSAAHPGLFEAVNAEDAYSPVPGLIHRYPTKVLLFPANFCAATCRYCFRRAMDRTQDQALGAADLEAALAYIAANPGIDEVILSGGDPLVLGEGRIEALLTRLAAIPHVTLVRFHTRMPVVLPFRITPALVAVLAAFKERLAPHVVIHVDSAVELTPEARRAIAALVDNGIPCLGACPLLKGINDTAESLGTLWSRLVRLRVKPYYLYHPDLVSGLRHFLVPLDEGVALVRSLYDRVSGLAMPLYCLDTAEGGGHVLVGPSYVEKVADGVFRVTNFEGESFTYHEAV